MYYSNKEQHELYSLSRISNRHWWLKLIVQRLEDDLGILKLFLTDDFVMKLVTANVFPLFSQYPSAPHCTIKLIFITLDKQNKTVDKKLY